MKLDQYGLPISQGDGGDSLHHYFTAQLRRSIALDQHMTENPAALSGVEQMVDIYKAIELMEVQPGIYVRNPDPDSWVSDPRNVSRDQLTAVIAYLAYHGDLYSYNQALKRLFWACLKRFMFAQNIYPNWVDPRKQAVKRKMPDFLTPDLWALFARGLLGKFSYPLTALLDVYTLLSTMVKLWAPINKDGTLQFRMPGPDDVDDDNAHNVFMVSQYRYPTPFSWMARKLFKRFRGWNNGTLYKNESSNMMGALAWYYRAEIGGNPEFAEIARPILEKY